MPRSERTRAGARARPRPADRACETATASSWPHLLELLSAGSWEPRLARHRPRLAYRGQAPDRPDLMTGLARLGPRAGTLERHLLGSFRNYAYGKATWPDTPWNWMAVAQHHGLPTRLLDWSFSPFVALHFATSDLASFDRDGVVWCADFGKAHRALPPELRRALRAQGRDVFGADLLAETVGDLAGLEGRAAHDFVLFWEPPAIDSRLVNQSALFSMGSSAGLRADRWLARRAGVLRAIVLPARLKWEVRDRLDQANVTERVLFPGLEGIARWLTRYYWPRPEAG